MRMTVLPPIVTLFVMVAVSSIVPWLYGFGSYMNKTSHAYILI